MGVPSYFFWLINKYSRNILKGNIRNNYAIFLDLNCAIHPAVKANPNFTIIEMLEAVTDYINDIIKFTQPSHLIYIAIDGVAPFAKMQQQRLRRYKSKIFADSEPTIDYNMISPGTEFMSSLNSHISCYFAAEIKTKKIIFSGSDEPGEGEHKIFNYLRKNARAFSKKNVIIYGLDSDLIFLSLINYSDYPIYLLREKEQYGKITVLKEKYVYLDINYLRNVIYSMLKTELNTSIKNVITDYVFFSFLLGNDFLPCIPTLFIREGGIDILMQSYHKVLSQQKEYLIEDGKINMRFISAYFKELSCYENDSIIHYIHERKKRIDTNNKKKRSAQNESYIEGTCPDLIYDVSPLESWKKRHYSYYFDIASKSEIPKIWQSYFTGMLWTLRYYTGIPVSWEWGYPYHAAPALSDMKKIEWTESEICINMDSLIISPIEQLMFILPRSSMHLIGNIYIQKKLYDNKKLYPIEKEIKYSLMNKKYLHEAICYLPYLDLDIIRKLVKTAMPPL